VLQKREQMWWLAACVVGLLAAAWAAGGFIGPLMAVFIVLFLAGAVLVEFDGRDHALPDTAGVPEPVDGQPSAEDPVAEPAIAQPEIGEPESVEVDEIARAAEADAREAANSLA